MVPTCKNIALYSPTSLNVYIERWLIATPCSSLYLFLYFLWHPYILTIFFINSTFCAFYGAYFAHASLQPQDIHAGIGPYFCNPGG